MAKNPYFGDKKWNNLETLFFLENRASSLFYIYQRLTFCKKSEKSNGGKYDNFLLQTNGRCWFHKDSKRVLIKSTFVFILPRPFTRRPRPSLCFFFSFFQVPPPSPSGRTYYFEWSLIRHETEGRKTFLKMRKIGKMSMDVINFTRKREKRENICWKFPEIRYFLKVSHLLSIISKLEKIGPNFAT